MSPIRRGGHDGFCPAASSGSHGTHARPCRTSVRVLVRLEHGLLGESLAAPVEGAHEGLLRAVRQQVRAEGARARKRVLANLEGARASTGDADSFANASK